jgi:hypothetical protein
MYVNFYNYGSQSVHGKKFGAFSHEKKNGST